MRSFTLVELLAVIAVLALLVVGAGVFVVNAVSWGRQTADQQTLAVLNMALTRYKTQGGRVTSLTHGTPISRVLQKMKTPVDWAGQSHQFLQQGQTFAAHSLEAVGDAAQYRFFRYDSYSEETPAAGVPTSTYAYGKGVGYVTADDMVGPEVRLQVTVSGTTHFALAEGSTIFCRVSGFNYLASTYGTSVYTFWASAGAADSTYAGSVSGVNCAGGAVSSLDVTGLTDLVSLNCSTNNLASLPIPRTATLATIDCSNNYMSKAALEDLFVALPNRTGLAAGTLTYGGNSGASGGSTTADATLANGKNWTLVGD